MKKNGISLAIAGAVLMLGASATSASAAGPAPQQAPTILHASAEADAGARIIVKYRAAGTARTLGSKLGVVEGAASRVLPAQARGRTASTTLKAAHLRKLAVGADVIALSRKLEAAELRNLVTEISADPAVEYAEIDRRVHPMLTPNDPFYANYQWNLFNPAGGIKAPPAWDVSRGEGVVVAVIDTGVLPGHPDLAANLLPGYDFITDAFVSRRPTDERVPGAFDYGDWNPVAGECGTGSPVRNSSWHGSHVAGTVAQVTNNSLGVAGVAFESKVLPIRALGRCGGYTSDIADAIVWASGGDVEGMPANQNPAEIINLSLGGSQACPAVSQAAVNTAVANGSLVVVAAGNSNGSVANFTPASCNNVVAVGASRITGGRASYSNYGAGVDLSAPGGGGGEDTGNDGWDGFILQSVSTSTTSPDQGNFGYGGKAGTSMAAPHVAAVAALVQSALAAADKPTLSPAQMETLLKETARPFPVSIPASTPIGTGIVDAKAALDKALEEPCDPATETCGPVATPLVNKVNVTNLSGAAGSETLYSFEAEAGAVLSFITLGGSGDVSLYVSFEAEPTETDFDAKSTRRGNNETVRFNRPQAGTYYVKLVGASAYSGVTLVARQ
jgi:serine protease